MNAVCSTIKKEIREYLDAQNFQHKTEVTKDDRDQFLQFLMQKLIEIQESKAYLSKQQFYDVLFDLSLEESEEDGLCYHLLLDTMDYVVGFHSLSIREGVLGEFIELMQKMD